MPEMSGVFPALPDAADVWANAAGKKASAAAAALSIQADQRF